VRDEEGFCNGEEKVLVRLGGAGNKKRRSRDTGGRPRGEGRTKATILHPPYISKGTGERTNETSTLPK